MIGVAIGLGVALVSTRALDSLLFGVPAIDAATMQAIRESAPHLTRLSAERVKQELQRKYPKHEWR